MVTRSSPNASHIDQIDSIEAEIESLEFMKEIVTCSGAYDPSDVRNYYGERIAKLHLSLEESISAHSLAHPSEGTYSMTRNRQTRCFVASLSFEMLSAIFLEASIASRTQFAKSVSQVSRYWRDVALNTPFIWSGIDLYRGTGREYLKFLRLLIQRSKSHPLDITVTVDAWDTKDSDVVAGDEPIFVHFDVLILEISRWRSFTCESARPSDAFMIVMPLSYLYAPVLESFEIASLTLMYDDPEMDLFQGGAPMLSRVSFCGILATSCSPPLASITSLQLHGALEGLTGQGFLNLLRSSPFLESLDLQAYIVAHEDLNPLASRGENVELASLRSFSFDADATPKYFLESLLNILRCPKLKRMTIRPWDIGLENLPTLAAALALPIPAYPELHYMELRGIECAQFAANFDFTQLPRLETVSLMRCTFPMSLLRLLLPSQGRVNDEECMWPSLRHIRLSNLGAEDFDCLCDIISYRQTAGGPIESVEIKAESLDKFPEKVSWMEQHVKVQRGRGYY